MNLEQMQIEAAEKLAGPPYMDKAPWAMVKTLDGPTVAKNHGFSSWAKVPGSQIITDDGPRVYLGPYLRIEDGNPWSSAAILARAGYEGPYSLLSWLRRLTKCAGINKMNTSLLVRPVLKVLKEGHQELANVLTIILLHEINPEAYEKGMEVLK